MEMAVSCGFLYTTRFQILGFELRTCEPGEGLRVGVSGEKTLALGASEAPMTKRTHLTRILLRILTLRTHVTQ
jgi:hypothetical protein